MNIFIFLICEDKMLYVKGHKPVNPQLVRIPLTLYVAFKKTPLRYKCSQDSA